MGMEQRKVANYVKMAGLSKGYYLHVFAGGIAFLGILMAYASRLLGEVNSVAANIPDPMVSAILQDRLFLIAVIFFLSFFAFVTSTVFYMIVLGQRVGGPVIAICAYIQELQNGNYNAKRELRKNDELVPIMTELKILAEKLKTKS
jgi:hypothetical protein